MNQDINHQVAFENTALHPYEVTGGHSELVEFVGPGGFTDEELKLIKDTGGSVKSGSATAGASTVSNTVATQDPAASAIALYISLAIAFILIAVVVLVTKQRSKKL